MNTCCTETAANRDLTLEFLFLDQTICKPCSGTGRALDEAAEIVAAPLAALGTSLEIVRTHVATRSDAIAHRLEISPTLRIDGEDIDPARSEGVCGTCGDLAGGATTVTCRTWHWRGTEYPAAPTGLIVEAILKAAVAGTSPSAPEAEGTYTLPGNLDAFFDARREGRPACC
ncbi:MAG: DUF2703 domain-containing protein [Pseudomonadota bacterium]